MVYTERIEALKSLISQRIVVIDGPRGTAIQAYNLEAHHFGGPEYDGCNEYLTITRPDIVAEIHQGHLDAGADILGTNSFGGTPIVLADTGTVTV